MWLASFPGPVVQTILNDALAPARTALLHDLRQQYPEMANKLTDANFNAGHIYLDPGRNLQDAAAVDRNNPGNNRTQNAIRREQRNASIENIDDNHAATLDSRRIHGNSEIASDDLLIGEGGDDTLRSHSGNDILIGGQGRNRVEGGEGRDTYVIGAGDTVIDSDGEGEVRWGSQQLTGGRHMESDPANAYRSEDGRFIYTLEHDTLSVTDTLPTDQVPRERTVIENFHNGQLGITLSGNQVSGGPPQVDPQRRHDQQRRPTIQNDHGNSSTIPPGATPATGINSDKADNRQGSGTPERGSFNDPFLDRAYAALLSGDSKELDRVSIEFSNSPEGQRMAQMGDQLLAQQQLGMV